MGHWSQKYGGPESRWYLTSHTENIRITSGYYHSICARYALLMLVLFKIDDELKYGW